MATRILTVSRFGRIADGIRSGRVARSLVSSFCVAIAAAAFLPLLSGCGGAAGAPDLPGTSSPDKTQPDTETRNATIKYMLQTVSRRASEEETPSTGTGSETTLTFEGGYEVYYRQSTEGVTGEIYGSATGLPASFLMDTDSASLRYSDGSNGEFQL